MFTLYVVMDKSISGRRALFIKKQNFKSSQNKNAPILFFYNVTTKFQIFLLNDPENIIWEVIN